MERVLEQKEGKRLVPRDITELLKNTSNCLLWTTPSQHNIFETYLYWGKVDFFFLCIFYYVDISTLSILLLMEI